MIVNLRMVLRVLGAFLLLLGLFMLAPLMLAMLRHEKAVWSFLWSALLCAGLGGAAVGFIRDDKKDMSVRDMFVLTSFVWLLAAGFGAFPLMGGLGISYTDAFFESMSGITTTGSTILAGLDDMEHSVLLWRSILQWAGGIGFIAAGVAILPMLNVGGMRLFQTESSEWGEKNTPKTSSLAKGILYVYLLLSVLCMVGYMLGGMNFFEAINHSMTTLSTGGYSTSDASMAHFGPACHWNGIIFMTLAGMPFVLFAGLVRKHYELFSDEQVRGYLILLLVAGVTLAIWLFVKHDNGVEESLRKGLFNAISVTTTTGYGLTDYGAWGALSNAVFLLLMVAGGCSGSTAGGVKVFRFQVAASLMNKHLRKLTHPSSIIQPRFNKQVVSEDITLALVCFCLMFTVVVGLITLILALTGLDLVTSLTGSLTAVSNVGPGLGSVIGPAANFSSLALPAKWALSIGMMLGRLEIITVAILIYPSFWRR